jgi:hypothetical protein
VRAYSFPAGTVLEIGGRRTTLSGSSSGDGIEVIDKIADLRPGVGDLVGHAEVGLAARSSGRER